PRSWNDLVYVPTTHKPYLPCLNASIDFPPFHSSLASQKRHIHVHALTRPYPSDSCKAIHVFHTRATHAGQLRTPTLPAHLLSSSECSPLYLSLLL
ncbi:unnamed protein product, partial [Hymenolepis diminuta]